MKVTSYEISKKLKELGFNKESYAGYMWDGDAHQLLTHNDSMNPKEEHYSKDILAYDLETILDVIEEQLPESSIKITPLSIEIYNCPLFESPNMKFQFWEEADERKENEVLADSAARLLILLHEKGIINFK